MSASSVSAPKHSCVLAAGLFRVRGFTQDDAHIFCLPEQIAGEIVGVLALVEEVMGAFGFKEFEVRGRGNGFSSGLYLPIDAQARSGVCFG